MQFQTYFCCKSFTSFGVLHQVLQWHLWLNLNFYKCKSIIQYVKITTFFVWPNFLFGETSFGKLHLAKLHLANFIWQKFIWRGLHQYFPWLNKVLYLVSHSNTLINKHPNFHFVYQTYFLWPNFFYFLAKLHLANFIWQN